MSVEKILNLLKKVRKTGTNKWSACCPVHDDNSSSLAIKEEDDGRVLIRCFAGCGAYAVVAALGMTEADLYPAKPLTGHSYKPVSKPWNATDVLTALAVESLVVVNCASCMATGNALSDSDRERLVESAARINAGLGVINE
jgi:hypothetical protein